MIDVKIAENIDLSIDEPSSIVTINTIIPARADNGIHFFNASFFLSRMFMT